MKPPAKARAVSGRRAGLLHPGTIDVDAGIRGDPLVLGVFEVRFAAKFGVDLVLAFATLRDFREALANAVGVVDVEDLILRYLFHGYLLASSVRKWMG